MFRNKRYIFLIMGNIISAYAIIYILRPNGLMTGGITGLSRVIENVFKDIFVLSPILKQYLFSIVYYVIALIVLGAAYLFLGKTDAFKILFLTMVYPLLLFVFTFLDLEPIIIPVITSTSGHFNDILVPAISFGFLSGISTGLILRSKYTTGGSDTIAKIIYRKLLPFLTFSQVLLIVDGIIIFLGLIVFDFRIVFYAIITKYISMKTIDLVVLGINRRVKMEIISSKVEEIVIYIQNSIHRGVTIVDTFGSYSKTKLQQLVTLCTPRESLKIKNFIASIDDNAFVYIVPSSTVWGKGFRNIHQDELS